MGNLQSRSARLVSGAGCYLVETAWGWCALRRGVAGIAECSLPSPDRDSATKSIAGASAEAPPDALLGKVADLLLAYFEGKQVSFDVALSPEGMTEFGERVLQACARIPWGETRSYGEIARAVASPRASRAVGQALGRNPVPIIVPCHRVIGADGSLVGFGSGLDMKRRLLQLEHSCSAG